jgi:3-oxoadipate enol-lactonase
MTPIVIGDARDFGLLLINPLGANQRFWDACVEIWRGGGVTSVAFDLRPALQDRDETWRPLSLAELASDVETVRKSAGLLRAVPIGCAIGSMIAATYAAQYPDKVAGLVVSNPTPRSSAIARDMLRERARIVLAEGMQAILPGAVDRAFLNRPRDSRYEAYYAAFAAQSARDYAFACNGSSSYDAETALREVRCPTLVIAGEHDVLLPASLGREVADLVQGSRFAIMPDAAHFVPYQKPAEFARDVLLFLAERVPLRTCSRNGPQGP